MRRISFLMPWDGNEWKRMSSLSDDGYRLASRMEEPPKALIRFDSSSLCDMKKQFVQFEKFVVEKNHPKLNFIL